MVFGQRWFFPIEKEINIHQLETLFENKYCVHTIKYDTFDIENKGIDVIAVSKKNNWYRRLERTHKPLSLLIILNFEPSF
jgi:hypothetical protein